MQRSSWGNSYRRSGAGAVQARPAPSRQAPPRHRSQQQQRRPLADERQPETRAWTEPTPHLNRASVPGGLSRDVGGNTPADRSSPEIEAERHRQSEIARIRQEILEIAREVADLQRNRNSDVSVSPAPNAGSGLDSGNAATREPRKLPVRDAAIRAPDSDARSRQTPMPPYGKRKQPVERTQRFAGKAGPNSSTPAKPTRDRQPGSIRDELSRFSSTKSNPAAERAGRSPVRRPWRVAAKAALLTTMLLVGSGAITLALWSKLPWLGHDQWLLSDTTASVPAAKAARSAQMLFASTGDPAFNAYPFEMPDTYGVYAVTDGQLTPLDPLPIRVADARVAISSPISKPPSAPIPGGTLQFAAYHRELATNVPESASVRIVAKVMQATSFAGGKPKAVPVEDAWAVRGGSIDLRIAPVAANKEMVLIRPADPAFTLSPGRYVLMFRNQAYDFSVAGEVSDTAHCLERSDLPDRTVYSECRELPR